MFSGRAPEHELPLGDHFEKKCKTEGGWVSGACSRELLAGKRKAKQKVASGFGVPLGPFSDSDDEADEHGTEDGLLSGFNSSNSSEATSEEEQGNMLQHLGLPVDDCNAAQAKHCLNEITGEPHMMASTTAHNSKISNRHPVAVC